MLEMESLLHGWKMMSLIREFDLYVKAFAETKEAVGYLHTSIGQEAVSVGIIENLREDDWMTSTYRNHSHGVARGLDIYRMVAELLGRKTGYCGGLGGSMHIADQDRNFIGSMGIVAGGIPIAAGAAFASRMLGRDQIALCFFGDGAIHQGAFHEGLEFAIKFEAPVLFVCENNLYAESTSSDYHLLHESVIGTVEPYGIKSIKIDGNDFELVDEVAKEMISWVRRNKKPAFIECMTYKRSGQYEGDTQTYKSAEEIEFWESRDPILLLGNRILSLNASSQPVLDNYLSENQLIVRDAFEKAAKDPYPSVDDLYQAVFAESGAN
jgi:TPP-dependent pyruvate/acetoin dehydrogenase alpha subunit